MIHVWKGPTLFESLTNLNQSITKIPNFHYIKASLELDATKIFTTIQSY